MAAGWIKDEGSWYFLYDGGAMTHDTWIDNYYVNSIGKWVKARQPVRRGNAAMKQ